MKPGILISVASVFLLAACSSDSITASTEINGTYTLTTLNGTALPATLVEEGITYRVNSGSLTIGGSTFTTTLDVTVLLAGQSFPLTGTCTGTLARNGNNLVFTTTASTSGDIDCEAGTASGSWDGANTVTVDAMGQQAVYKRQ